MSNAASSVPLTKTKQRIADHGEVFTPDWMVDEMLNLVQAETERIDSRVLEPACGSGNFLVPVLRRKLATVEARYGKSEFEKRHYALLAVMCVYGIELLADNATECRARLVESFKSYVNVDPTDPWAQAAQRVLTVNIVQGDALSMTGTDGAPIVFPEWAYLGRGKYQRRDFQFDTLTQRSSVQGTLWENLEEHEVFVPTRTFPVMSMSEIAA
jgi:hypothetical protein